MALKFYWANDLTGGGTGALDKIPTANWLDKYGALVVKSGYLYAYECDDDLTGSEDSPWLIVPDDESGDLRLNLLGAVFEDVKTKLAKLYDTDQSNLLSLKWNEASAADYILNLAVGGASRTLTLNENLTVGDGTNITITGVTAARTITLNENLTIGDGTDITITGVTAARTFTMNENFTIGDGNDGTLTYGNSGDTLTINETMILDGASGKTLTLEENFTIADGTDITITGVTQANTLTLHESFTIGNGYDGTLTYSAASKVVTVAGSCTLNDWFDQAVKAASNVSFGTIGCGTITTTGDIIVAGAHGLRVDTSDASDNESVKLSGGGAYSYDRGALVLLYGNENTDDEGDLKIYAGNSGVASHGCISFLTGAGTEAMGIDSNSNINIAQHNATTVGLKLGGTLITASAAELNILDGKTSFEDGATTDQTEAEILTLLGLTSVEVDQVGNIAATTISEAQWGYLGSCGAGGGQLMANLTTGESTQLEAIGAVTIDVTQWGYLGSATAAGGAVLDAANDAAILALLSGDAGAAFAWNGQNLTSVGTIGCGTITSTGNVVIADAGNIGSTSDTDAIAISSAGVLNFSGQSGCLCTLSANQDIKNSTYVRVRFDTEAYDIQNEFNHTTVSGTADATEANKLHDTDAGFTSGLVGAWVHNTSDDTHTTVSGFVDDGELDLTDDIMVNGENYVVYHARFTAAATGKYILSYFGVPDEGLADQAICLIRVKINGSLYRYARIAASGTDYQTPSLVLPIDLSANDYIEPEVYHNHSAPREIHKDYTSFGIAKIA